MTQAKNGDTVKVHYTGKLDDGTVFDTTSEGDPLEFTLGEGRIIAGFEQAVEGMKPGESKTTKIEAEEAYGQRRDDLILSFGREEIPSEIPPELGQRVQLRRSDGTPVPAIIVDVNDQQVTLDANHPLAGLSLTFDIELVELA